MADRSRSVGFLIVGAGFLGTRRAAAVATARGARLVAIHDCDPKVAAVVAREHGAERLDDFDAALQRPDIDAVVVATPHADHFPQVLASLEAGKHVFCEKPLTICPEDARLLVARAEELGLRLATGFNHRFYPPIADALDLARGGAIGRVELVRARIGHMATRAFLESWHTDVARSGGGSLMDNGPHVCDLIRQLLGEIVVVDASLDDEPGLPSGCEIDAYARFQSLDGSIAELRTSWRQASGYLSLDIQGTDGRIQVETAPWRLSGQLVNGQRMGKRYFFDRVRDRAFQAMHGTERSLAHEIEAFIGSRPGMPNYAATGWDGVRVTEMIDAAYRSSRSGEPVQLVSRHEPSGRNLLIGEPSA
jgi:predicted dehydrogenase